MITADLLYSYLNLESTKTGSSKDKSVAELYSYLNLESTKTKDWKQVAFIYVVQLLKS